MSERSARVAAAFLALSTLLTAAHAEDDPALAGTRMRVVKKGGNEQVVGRLVQRSPAQLVLDTEGRGRVTVPYAQVARLQVSEGRNRGKGVWLGVLVGLVVGGGAYAATTEDCSEGGCAERFAWMAGSAVAAGALVGLVAAPERWRTVDRVPDVTSLDRSRRFAVAVRPAPGGVSATASLAF